MKNLFIATVILAFFATSCSKEKKALKNIEGTWSLNTWKADSAGVESEHISWAFAQAFGVTGADYIFDKCESGETCKFYTISKPISLSSTDTGSYSISSDGATFTMDSIDFNIDKLNKSTFEISREDDSQEWYSTTVTEIITFTKE